MNKELFNDYIKGLSISELSNKYKISKTRVYKEIAEYSKEQEKILKEIIKLINDLEPTFNRKGVSSDTNILGTIIKDYFYDNASDLLKTYFEKIRMKIGE